LDEKNMAVEKSAGAIIFRKEPPDAARGKEGRLLFLLLRYPSGSRTQKDYWDLPKGHIEKGEKPEGTVKREVKEETGLKDIEFLEGFKETIKYFFKWKNENILKFVTFYLAKTRTKEIKISGEHTGYKWLPYSEALEQLTFKNAKEILKKAHRFLLQDFPRRKGAGETLRLLSCAATKREEKR
jgi:bis(5'-nucleosidyl)-tetraphosphatase